MHQRWQKLQQKLSGMEFDALLISHPANRRYISGFTGSSGYILAAPDKGYLITDFRYLEQAGMQSPHLELAPWKTEGLAASLSPILEKERWRRLAFEETHLTFSLYRNMKESLAVELVPCKNLVEDLRVVKDAAEIGLLRQGAAVVDRAYTYLLEAVRPGMTEAEAALELEMFLRRQGAEGIPFPFIVASGVRGSMPHGIASEKILAKGELVTVDFGASFAGYATDMTRTFALGKIDNQRREIYSVVQAAQEKASKEIRAGMTCKQADAIAREMIEQAGFGEYFGHGLGHGVGLEVHEKPALNPRGEELLLAGMVVTVEPGIYLPGLGGVRIEDMVLIGDDQSEVLTGSPRELITI